MTLEKAIELKAAVGRLMYSNNKDIRDYNTLIEFIDVSLHPVSREQVERMRGEWIAVGAITCKCSRCQHSELSTRANEYLYCPACGAPMTDEAVDMAMERLEALNNAVD